MLDEPFPHDNATGILYKGREDVVFNLWICAALKNIVLVAGGVAVSWARNMNPSRSGVLVLVPILPSALRSSI